MRLHGYHLFGLAARLVAVQLAQNSPTFSRIHRDSNVGFHMTLGDLLFSELDQAKHAVVHDFPGGAVRLAPLVGMKPGTLSNKVNPSIDTHHLSVDEAVAIQAAARNYAILYAEASALNHSCILLADFSGVADLELLDSYANYHAQIGELAVAIRDMLKDGRVELQEVIRIKQEFMDVVQAGFGFIARLEGLASDRRK